WPGLLESRREPDQPDFTGGAADDLKADRQSGLGESVRQRECRLAGRIVWESELDELIEPVLEVFRRTAKPRRGARERRRERGVVGRKRLHDLARRVVHPDD